MSDVISQLIITQIGEALKDDGVISNENLEDGLLWPYSTIQNTANAVTVYSFSIPTLAPNTDAVIIPNATLDKIQTILVSEGVIHANSSNTAQHSFYAVAYSANNQWAFTVAKGADKN